MDVERGKCVQRFRKRTGNTSNTAGMARNYERNIHHNYVHSKWENSFHQVPRDKRATFPMTVINRGASLSMNNPPRHFQHLLLLQKVLNVELLPENKMSCRDSGVIITLPHKAGEQGDSSDAILRIIDNNAD